MGTLTPTMCHNIKGGYWPEIISYTALHCSVSTPVTGPVCYLRFLSSDLTVTPFFLRCLPQLVYNAGPAGAICHI